MTPEQIQQAIEGILSVQRERQESQIKQKARIDALLELSEKHEQRFSWFYGYHMEKDTIRFKLGIAQLEGEQGGGQ
ncbi:hypothetical protein [Synechococcus sp. PCC 7336]|uniref:hypothetical protein n=1 Tax=Synechococcus sp. PCC 7336 TaxID=195250 RepID=UPI0003454384|nr:hypothetical protein [Synechococcus sp. PCC 7336]